MPHKPSRPCHVPMCLNVAVSRGACREHAAAVETDRRTTVTGRGWYYSEPWRRLRQRVLQEEPICSVCRREGVMHISEDVDHKEPHGGSPVLFWDRQNLQALCHRHHSQKTRREQL